MEEIHIGTDVLYADAPTLTVWPAKVVRIWKEEVYVADLHVFTNNGALSLRAVHKTELDPGTPNAWGAWNTPPWSR